MNTNIIRVASCNASEYKLNKSQKLKHLNVAVNRLWELPRGFGACPMLQVLDITYNNLTELPNNFHYLNTLRLVVPGPCYQV